MQGLLVLMVCQKSTRDLIIYHHFDPSLTRLAQRITVLANTSQDYYTLTQNEFSLKDSFDAAQPINNIPRELLNSNEYWFISPDIVSLFTNVPLKRILYRSKRIQIIKIYPKYYIQHLHSSYSKTFWNDYLS